MDNQQGKSAYPFLLLLLLTLFFATYARNLCWQNEFAVWGATLKNSPHKWRPHYRLGLLYYLEKNLPDRALEEFEIALNLRPDSPDLHNNIGRVYQAKGLFDEAKKEYAAAIWLGLPSATAHINMGTIYLDSGDLKTALHWFQEAIKKEPANAAAIVSAGFVYGDLGEYQKAIEMHKKAVSVNPYYYTAHFGLALAYEGTRQFKEAVLHWEEYLRLAPETNEWRQEAANHLRRLKEMELR